MNKHKNFFPESVFGWKVDKKGKWSDFERLKMNCRRPAFPSIGWVETWRWQSKETRLRMSKSSFPVFTNNIPLKVQYLISSADVVPYKMIFFFLFYFLFRFHLCWKWHFSSPQLVVEITTLSSWKLWTFSYYTTITHKK